MITGLEAQLVIILEDTGLELVFQLYLLKRPTYTLKFRRMKA